MRKLETRDRFRCIVVAIEKHRNNEPHQVYWTGLGCGIPAVLLFYEASFSALLDLYKGSAH